MLSEKSNWDICHFSVLLDVNDKTLSIVSFNDSLISIDMTDKDFPYNNSLYGVNHKKIAEELVKASRKKFYNQLTHAPIVSTRAVPLYGFVFNRSVQNTNDSLVANYMSKFIDMMPESIWVSFCEYCGSRWASGLNPLAVAMEWASRDMISIERGVHEEFDYWEMFKYFIRALDTKTRENINHTFDGLR